MYGKMKEFLAKELADIKAAGLYKNERIITTPQRADIKVNDGEDVLNFCQLRSDNDGAKGDVELFVPHQIINA